MSQKAELVQTKENGQNHRQDREFLVLVACHCERGVSLRHGLFRFSAGRATCGRGSSRKPQFRRARWFTFRVPLESLTGDAIKTIIFVAVSMLMISVLSWSLILRQLRSILKTVERNRPFTEENARRISVIGWILVVGSVVFSVAKAIAGEVVVRALDVVPGMTVTFQWDVSLALAGFCLLILAGVFRYGAYLQQEYDTTV